MTDDVDLGIEDDRKDTRADAEREGRGVQREIAQRPTHAAHPTAPRQVVRAATPLTGIGVNHAVVACITRADQPFLPIATSDGVGMVARATRCRTQFHLE